MFRSIPPVLAVAFVAAIFCVPSVGGQSTWTNWETPPVHPLDITPDGNTLLSVNLPDARLEVFDITGGVPEHLMSVPVGIDPASVRARTNTEAWVVNTLSDSVNVVDLANGNVRATLPVGDEPRDVIFAGSPERAFVSVGTDNEVWVFDPANLAAVPQVVEIFGEEPRALARSADGTEVYVAIFDSGNGSTILGGGGDGGTLGFPPNVVNNLSSPYSGTNPPPNDGANFEPPIAPGLPTPPGVGLIVRKDAAGAWLDDNGADWTNQVSGPQAFQSGRIAGWDLPDHDVAVIDTATLAVSYVDRLMTTNMVLAVHPVSGNLTVVGTEATNEIRFEPNLKGTFVRVHLAMAAPDNTATTLVDLNPHLDYLSSSVPLADRALAVGDPRAIVWNADGSRGWVAGKGSANVLEITSGGARAVAGAPLAVGEGASGLALDEARARLYVHEHFAGTISAIDIGVSPGTSTVLATVVPHDPTPEAIRTGRPLLYGTHLTSGLGQVACASCHIDARTDRLAWDLGDPAGTVRPFTGNCGNGVDFGCDPYHPMKGPMSTQTLQDIVGKEPHHWRGDRDGIEEFAGAFAGLLGDDAPLDPTSMQEFEDFLATIHFPPNPFRNIDNSLPSNLPLDGHYTTGRFTAPGQPLPNGNAVQGLLRYRTASLDGPFQCVSCHTLPIGIGADVGGAPFNPQFLNPGPNGEAHHAIVSVDGSTNVSMKTPQLRNLYQKVGFEATQLENTAGFGFLHDGSVDSIARFVSEPAFSVSGVQDVANLVAFMLAFSGSDLPAGSLATLLELPGTASQDTHAAVGIQVTFDGTNNSDADLLAILETLQAEALAGRIDIIAKGIHDGEARGWVWTALETFQSDRAAETTSYDDLRLGAAAGAEITFTAVPDGHGIRAGVDRDSDGAYDHDELDACSDPADAMVVPVPGLCPEPPFSRGDCNSDGSFDLSDPVSLLFALFGGAGAPSCPDACDMDDGGALDIADAIFALEHLFGGGPPPAAPFPGCGPDPVPDALDPCAGSAFCP